MRGRIVIFLIIVYLSFGIAAFIIPEIEFDRNQAQIPTIFPLASEFETSITPERYISSLPLDFWSDGLSYVESFSPNMTIESTANYTYENRPFISQIVTYFSPNWINQENKALRIKANIFYPLEFHNKGIKLPGIMLMHGLTNRRQDMFEIAQRLCNFNYTILIPDHPGHGESEGAKPTTENFFFQGQFNQSCHYYLSTAAAMQGIRILENHMMVNATQIIVSGFSYGGLNSMYVGAVYSTHIKAVLPMSAVGGFNQSNIENSIFLMLGQRKETVNSEFWTQNLQYFDPLYYLQKPNYPPIVWMCGTHDLVFYYEQLNLTFNLSPKNMTKYLQIHPNEHHGVTDMEASMNYFIKWQINHGSAPPDILHTNQYVKTDFFGDTVQVKIQINSSAPIQDVQVTFRYKNQFGDPWKSHPIQRKLQNGTISEWSGIIPKGFLSSVIEYYYTINVEAEGNVWFTSQIFDAGRIRNHLSLLGIILIIALISYPIQSTIKRKYIHEYHEIQKKFHPKNQHQIKKSIVWELLFVIESEALIIVSFWLPWVTQSNGITVSLAYIIERSFAWSDFEVSLLLYMPAFYMSYIIFAVITSLRKPFAGGIMNMVTPILILLVFSADVLNLGFYIQVIMAMSQIAFGEWKDQVVISLLEDSE